MARMRTFLIYALLIIGFFFLSYVLENGLIENMYHEIQGSIYTSDNRGVGITDIEGKATKINGYIKFKVKNNTSEPVDGFVQVDMFSKQGLLAMTKYISTHLEANETKSYQISFRADEIADYRMAFVSEMPDKSNIISILGWEFDLTDVLGMDLTNAKIFGVKISELFSWESAHIVGVNAWNWIKLTLASVPWWGYAIGGGIVLWHLPVGFLFGIFPF